MLLSIGTAAFAQQWQTLSVTGQLPNNGVSHSAVFDPLSNKLIVYGGTVTNLVPQNDVWILSNVNGNGGSATWAKLTISGGPARWAHSAAYDAANKRMMVFGGIDESIVRSSETWVLSNADGTAGTPAWTKVASAGSGPIARREAYSSYDAISNRLIVFGGEDQSARELNDVWVLSNANGLGGSASWTRLTPAGTLPTIRGYGASVYDPSTNRLIIYGGTSTYDPETMLGDVWVLTNANGLGATPAWIHLNPNTPSGTPAARSLPAMIYDSALNRAVIFGGYTTCSNAGPCIVTSDAWVLQNATGTDLTPTAWIPLSPSGTPSQNASFTPAAFDPVTDQLIAANDLTSIWLLSNPSARRIRTYDATSGTTPQVQGWPYSGDNDNPAPTVSGGALIENTTAGAQYWSQADSSLDLSQSAVLEAVLKIDSSNYIANIGTGTREGYYLGIGDGVSGYTIGLADSGFNINSIVVPNQNLTPYPIGGAFHAYRLAIQNRLATFSIDGVVLVSNIQPTTFSFGPKVEFGGAAGASRSVSELRFLCYGTTSADCAQALPDLTITKSHTGNFTQGQTGATYTISISNGGLGPTAGNVSVTDTLPTGLTATALAGMGWNCTLGTLTCTRSDVLAASASYPAITLTVNVASNAPPSATNIVTVSGGGDSNTSNNSASNQTTITPPVVSDLTVTKTHTGSFAQGQTGATYSITVSNSGTGPTTGGVTATDTLPTGLTATAMAGTGWSCTLATLTCTRSDVLASAASYPVITLTVNVANSASASLTNTAIVSGGGETNTANDTGTDPTTITPLGTLGNLALSKLATQSSICAGACNQLPLHGPENAVDGNTDGNYLDGSVTHTNAETNAWWQVDLGASATVSSVVVWNRTDCCAERLSDYWVFVSNTPFGSTDTPRTLQNRAATWGSHQTAAPNPSTTIAAPAAQGQFVRVQLSGSNYLSLAEVQVMGVLNGLANPDLMITKSHTGNFTEGQTGATYTVTVTNGGTGPTTGVVTMTDTLPTGLTATAIAGTGWSCTLATLTCTRSDALAPSASYPAITLTVNVASNAPASVTNTATVSGGGELNTANDTASDMTAIGQVVLPVSYSMLNGQSGSFSYQDKTYNGTGCHTCDGAALSGGIGQLTDGVVGGQDWFSDLGHGPAYEWVAWSSIQPTIVFDFGAIRTTSLLRVHSNNDMNGGVFLWDSVTVDFSTDRVTFSNALTYTTTQADRANSLARFIEIPLPGTAARYARAQFTHSHEWMFVSDIQFQGSGPTLVPDLTITKTHADNFVRGQAGAAYTLTATNAGGSATSGQVAVSDTLPTGLTATAISGTGWTCTLSTLNCTRSDALAASASYPAITLTVSVASNAPASVTNTATVSGGGEVNTSNDTANDVTTVTPPPDLTITKTHAGNFVQSQTGAIYTITASNLGPGSTTGTVTVTDTLPTGLTATAIGGTGWTCVLGTLTCTRSDTLAAGASYPAITLTVNVASNVPASVTNAVVVSGGGEVNTGNDAANDVATVAPAGGISATPAALDFGAVPITTSSTKSVTITSTGLNPLTISSIVVGGNFYTLSNLPLLPAVLQPAGTVSFSVTFAPLGTISAPGTVTLTSNATTSPTTISLFGSGTPPPLPPAAAITLTTDQAVYRRGQPVQISGKVTAADGSGISNIPVAVQVSLNGTLRSFNPYTNARGGYQVVFQPTSTDGGAFSITAVGTSGGATQTATQNFRIVGLQLSPNSLSQDQVMGSTVIVSLTLQNVGDATLSNLTFAVTVTPTGLLGATFSQSVSSLNPGATGTVAVVLTAPMGNPPPMPVGVQVNITATDSTSGASDQESSSFVITLRPAVSTPMLTPTSLTVGVNPGKSLTRHFVVKNGGYLPMNNATVTLQDPRTFNWVSLGNANLGNLAAGDSRQFDVMINPPTNLVLATYAVVFNVSGGTTPLQGTVNISVTQSTMGAAAFVVSDDTGAKVGGATVTLYGKTNGKMFQGVAGGEGSASIGGVDAGDYSYVVAAPSHDPGNGSVTVTANASASVNVLLSYDVVTLTFTVTPTTIVDQYNVTLNITYSTTLPKPALQVFPYSLDLSFFPENAPNGQLACSLSVTNTHPTASVRNLSLDASQIDISQPRGQRIHVLLGSGVSVYQVGTLAGKATANVPCYATLDGGAVPTHSAGNIVVQANYDFSLDGQVLQGTTTTNVPVSYVRPSDFSYQPVPFIYDQKTDPANPVLKYDAGSFVYTVTSNRIPVFNLLKPSGSLFGNHNLIAFTEAQAGTTSIDVINANSANVFWHSDFSSLKQSLLGNGDMTTYDISTLDGGLTLQQVLAAQVAINPSQILNNPTYLGFEGQWTDATMPSGYLIPIKITTLSPAGITIPRPPSGPTVGCLNPEDPQCKDPNPTFQAPAPSKDGQILLAFDQTIRLERQAFNAMLGIGARAPLTNTVASIQIRDAGGNDASNKFFVLVTSDAAGATRGGTVSGQVNVSWQLIPNAAAGGTSAQGTQYQVQARLNYVVSGTAKSASTQVVTITVLPSPKLTVAYSAPFVVMTGKEAKIRVTLQNVGYGIARNLSIQSAQPRITASIPATPLDQLLDNPGPLVAFNLTGSSNTADGAGFQAGNLSINFGNVAPGATVSGSWTLQVSQKGFFIDINSTFTHTDYQGIQLDPLIVTPTTTLVPAIGGTITAGSGHGIPNLTVALSQGGVAKGSDATDISGVYYISDLASGNYLEQVTDLTGTVLASKNITVLGDQGTNFIDFVFQNYNPTQALILINSNPPGFSFTADGVTYQTPQSFQWAVGSNHTLGALNVAGPSIAVGWSDGETAGISSGGATASSRLALVANGASAANATRNITVDGFGQVLGILTVSPDTYNRYNRTPVTPNPTFPNDDKIDHKWPSRNNRGDMVWSQKDPNNPSAPWQVWEQPSGGIRQQITFDQHSHERPVISDNGTIAWFQDSTGGGLGYAIMRLDPGSNSPSTIEYSSRKLCQTIYDSNGHPISSTCAPPEGAQEHDAGKNFGISSDGRTISYFTFFDNGNPTDRPFDINGQPLKDSSGNKVAFIGYDSPDINFGSALVYSDDFRGPGSIYLATTTQPLTSTIIDGPGNPQQDDGPLLVSGPHPPPPLAQFPHISDGSKPEIAYLKNKVSVNHWPGSGAARWVDIGLSADITGTGTAATIVYERVVDGFSQIFIARPRATGSVTLLDPVSSLLDGDHISTDRELLATNGQAVKGAATDGVARIVVKFNAPSPGTAVFSLVDSNGQPLSANDENGQLQDLAGSQASNSVTDTSASSSKGDKAFAVYTAPSQFVRSGVPNDHQVAAQRQVFIDVKFTPTSGQLSDAGPSPLILIRPMVFLVHGIWSSADVWNQFGALSGTVGDPTADPRFYVQRADYRLISDQGFATTASGPAPLVSVVYDELKVYLEFFKQDNNVAAVQADVVTHSMGGPVVRTVALQPGYLSDPQFPTFGKGPIRKLITIAGVHKGSPLAGFLLDKKNSCLATLFKLFGDDPTKGAVQDLQVDSAGIQDINAPGVNTPFPAHTIIGLTNGNDQVIISGLIQVLATPVCLKFVTFSFAGILGAQNDLLVGADSQYGFYIVGLPTTSPFSNVVHNSLFSILAGGSPNETSAPAIAARVVTLLDIRASDPTVFLPLPNQP